MNTTSEATGTRIDRVRNAAEAARQFCVLLDGADVHIPATGMLAGPAHLSCVESFEGLGHTVHIGEDNLHFAMNLETLLRLGFAGVAAEARRNASGLDGERGHYLSCVADAHEAACRFATRHAEAATLRAGCASPEDRPRLHSMAGASRTLGRHAPRTFHEAVQLFWYAWCMRGHGTIGRLDQYIHPFFEADLASGAIDREAAKALLIELWENINAAGTGDTLSNLMVGGTDRDGKDATNETSYLMLDASLAVRKTEPHLSVRVNAATPREFLDRAAGLQLVGHGQGTIYSDDAIVPALVAAGVPLESARNYANDGCTEVAIDGESSISFVQMEAMKALELALFNGEATQLPGTPHGRYIYAKTASRDLETTLRAGYRSGDFAAMTSYEEFYAAFLDQYFHHLDAVMDSLCQRIRQSESDSVSSPFMAGTFPKTLSTGRDPFRGGFTVPCYSVFSGSLPTVADCLAAIGTVVFEDRAASPGELLQALRDDFVGHEQLRARCVRAPKFGNDDDYVDAIASDLATRFCARVEAHPTPSGAPFWPALYTFRFNDFAKLVGATPDGRRWGDPLAEHYSPTPGRARSGPAAVIRSAAKGPLSRACGSSIFHVSLTRSVAPETQSGRDRVRQLVTSALSLGVAVMNVAVYDVDALRAAKREPERFGDLIVRVWGFSARFVDLSSDMQDHIIERAVSAECG